MSMQQTFTITTQITDLLFTCKYSHNIQIYYACVYFQKSSPDPYFKRKLLPDILM